jgi:hypothetical protein
VKIPKHVLGKIKLQSSSLSIYTSMQKMQRTTTQPAIARFVDIGEIDDHHCFNFLFIIYLLKAYGW